MDFPLRWLYIGWALLFAAAVVSLWRREPAAVNRALTLLIGFIGYSALRLLLFTQADYDRQRLPFVLLILLICAIVLIFCRLNVAAGDTTRKISHDR